MEIRNRKKGVHKNEKKITVQLHNEFDWDYHTIAEKKLEIIKQKDPGNYTKIYSIFLYIIFIDGTNPPILSETELKRVRKFQEKVQSLEYKRMSSKYNSSTKSNSKLGVLRVEKSIFRQTYDTISPLLSVLVTIMCSLFGSNYFLKNVIHEFTGRIAIGLVVGTILGFIEVYFILKRFQAEWDTENIVKF